MPALTAYSDADVAAMKIRELGVKDGSSPTVTFDVNGSTMTREFLCAWDRRYDFCRYMCGDVSVYTESGSLRISRLLPQRMPAPPLMNPEGDDDAWPDFYAVKVLEMTGHAWRDFDPDGAVLDPDDPIESSQFGDGSGEDREYVYSEDTINRFLCAKVKILAQVLPYEIVSDQFTASEFDRYCQFIPLGAEANYVTQPSSTQNYLDPTNTGFGHRVPVPYPTGLTETVYKFRLRLHRWPYEAFQPGSALQQRLFGDGTDTNPPWVNSLNGSSFYNGAYVRGTVMLEKVTDQLDLSLLSTHNKKMWQIDLDFAVQPYGWNTSWAFPNSNEYTSAANKAKRMLVGRGTTYPVGLNPPDYFSNYNSRDFEQLANPGT